jgi:hypothetical protein
LPEASGELYTDTLAFGIDPRNDRFPAETYGLVLPGEVRGEAKGDHHFVTSFEAAPALCLDECPHLADVVAFPLSLAPRKGANVDNKLAV